ncbi:hypothetical protein CF641_38260, partial [Burkholderia pseudomallei]
MAARRPDTRTRAPAQCGGARRRPRREGQHGCDAGRRPEERAVRRRANGSRVAAVPNPGRSGAAGEGARGSRRRPPTRRRRCHSST